MESMALGMLDRVNLPPGLYCGGAGRRGDLIKKKHAKRGVVTPALVRTLSKFMREGGGRRRVPAERRPGGARDNARPVRREQGKNVLW